MPHGRDAPAVARPRGGAAHRTLGPATTASLSIDSRPVADGRGIGRVLLRLRDTGQPDGAAPAVLVLAPLPGVVARAVLLEPREAERAEADGEPPAADQRAGAFLDLATAQRHPFDPPPGSVAARLRAFQERHPRLWAARHVALGVAKVLGSLLGVAVLVQALVAPLLRWLSGLLPAVDLPDLPLPDIDVPWPDPELPDLTLPGWVAAVLATAKFWVPVLVRMVLAAREARRAPGAGRPRLGRRPGR